MTKMMVMMAAQRSLGGISHRPKKRRRRTDGCEVTGPGHRNGADTGVDSGVWLSFRRRCVSRFTGQRHCRTLPRRPDESNAASRLLLACVVLEVLLSTDHTTGFQRELLQQLITSEWIRDNKSRREQTEVKARSTGGRVGVKSPATASEEPPVVSEPL